MPYVRRGKCVFNSETGQKKGCSKTVEGAKKYLAALYANEPKPKKGKK